VDWLTQTVVAPDDFEVGAIVTGGHSSVSRRIDMANQLPSVGWGLAVPHTICMVTSRTT